MWSLTEPSGAQLDDLRSSLASHPVPAGTGLLGRGDLAARRTGVFSANRSLWIVAGDANVVGHGVTDFRLAVAAVHDWVMFDQSWTSLAEPTSPIESGATVALSVKMFGSWWSCGCRITQVRNEPSSFSFDYRALPGHPERGDERFEVRMNPEGDVVFAITAASRPGRWFTWLALPVTLRAQRRFRLGAIDAMRAAIRLASNEVLPTPVE